MTHHVVWPLNMLVTINAANHLHIWEIKTNPVHNKKKVVCRPKYTLCNVITWDDVQMYSDMESSHLYLVSGILAHLCHV